jgi:hypothetical protein
MMKGVPKKECIKQNALHCNKIASKNTRTSKATNKTQGQKKQLKEKIESIAQNRCCIS